MRTIPSRLALIVVLAMAAPALVVHGQQNPEAMPQAGLVRLLDEDKVASGVTVDARADPVALSANDDIDFVFFDMEHGPYDVSALRTWMQWLLNPAAIAATGDAMAGKAVIVRIPATGRELDQNIWMVKQVLDVGAHGIIFPTVETAEQALMAIRAMRYPQRLGAPDPEPAGLRGTNPRLAARYWGLSVPDYIERADVWRLDPPNGNLLPWILIESPLGVANVREIARQLSERNIGAVLFAGSETGGDMLNTHEGSLEAVAQAIDTVLAAGKVVRPPRRHDEHDQHGGAHRAGSAPVHGWCDAHAAEGSGPLGRRLPQLGKGPPRVRHGAVACQGRNRDGRHRTGPARGAGACRRRCARRGTCIRGRAPSGLWNAWPARWRATTPAPRYPSARGWTRR